MDLKLDLKLSASQPALEGGVSFGGAVWVSESLQQVKLTGALLTVGLTGAELPGGALDASLKTDVSLDLAAQTLELPELVLEALGLKEAGASCHSLCHSFAIWSLAGGAKLESIQDTLGHSSVETTQVYAKIVDKMTENPTLYLEKMLTG